MGIDVCRQAGFGGKNMPILLAYLSAYYVAAMV